MNKQTNKPTPKNRRLLVIQNTFDTRGIADIYSPLTSFQTHIRTLQHSTYTSTKQDSAVSSRNSDTITQASNTEPKQAVYKTERGILHSKIQQCVCSTCVSGLADTDWFRICSKKKTKCAHTPLCQRRSWLGRGGVTFYQLDLDLAASAVDFVGLSEKGVLAQEKPPPRFVHHVRFIVSGVGIPFPPT